MKYITHKQLLRRFVMRRMRDSGMTYKDIGKQFGVTGQRVSFLVQDADRYLTTWPVPKTPQEKQDLAAQVALWEHSKTMVTK